jgi:hypothetical protein
MLSGSPSRHLTFEQRLAVRLGVDAVVREALHRQESRYRRCPGCDLWQHRSDFPNGRGRVCRYCVRLMEGVWS